MSADLENPAVYVGVLKGRDDVTMVINPGTAQEQRLCFAPIVALAIAAELATYGQRQLDRQAAALSRHEANSTVVPEKRVKLDS